MFTNKSSALLLGQSLKLTTFGTVVDVVVLVISGLIIFTNTITIAVICKYLKLRTITNMLILNLSLGDLLLGITIPLCVSVGHVSSPNNNLCRSCFLMILLSLSVSLCTVAVIALERYFAIVHPFVHRVRVTKRLVLVVIALVWILCISLILSNLANRQSFCNGVERHVWHTIVSVVLILLIIFTCAYAYIRIYLVAKEHVSRIQAFNAVSKDNAQRTGSKASDTESLHDQITMNNVNSNCDKMLCDCNVGKSTKGHHHRRNGQSNKHDTGCEGCKKNKIAKMTFLVLIVMIMCWMPVVVCKIISLYVNTSFHNFLFTLASVVLYCNSFLNPILYFWQNWQFRKAYRNILTCH